MNSKCIQTSIDSIAMYFRTIYEDLKNLFQRMERVEGRIEKVEQRLDFNASYRKDITERVEKLEVETNEALNEPLIDRLYKMNVGITNHKSRLLAIANWLQRLDSKQRTNNEQIESLQAQLTELTTELRNYRMQNLSLQNEIEQLKDRPYITFHQGAD